MNGKKISIAGCLLAAMGLGCFATELKFQQGNLRRNGAGISGAYQTDVTYIRKATPETNYDYLLYPYMGTTSTTDFRHLLLGFDLSYIETLGSNYTINSVELQLTKYNDTVGSGTSTFDMHLTDAFDETTATWTNSGTVGATLSSLAIDTQAVGGTVFSFSGANWIAAVTNALNDASNTLYALGKRRAEGGAGAYYVQLQSDEASTHGIDGRPKLVVDITYDPPLPTFAATIVDCSVSNNVMRLEVNAPEYAHFYSPLGTPDLVTGSWTNVPHSIDGSAPFITTNLSYSTPEGINEVIYIQAADTKGFFGISND